MKVLSAVYWVLSEKAKYEVKQWEGMSSEMDFEVGAGAGLRLAPTLDAVLRLSADGKNAVPTDDFLWINRLRLRL